MLKLLAIACALGVMFGVIGCSSPKPIAPTMCDQPKIKQSPTRVGITADED